MTTDHYGHRDATMVLVASGLLEPTINKRVNLESIV
jgi:hypothetical protein